MKKLICAKEVEALAKQGATMIHIDFDTIVTPSARDAATALGLCFESGAPAREAAPPASAAMQPAGCGTGVKRCGVETELDTEMIYEVLKAMMGKGMLEGVEDSAPTAPSTPYRAQKGPGGLKLVVGESVQMEDFDTGNPGNKVYFQEVIGKEDSSMSAGFLTIDHSSFDWELSYEEIDLVLEGTLQVVINGKTYTAKKGDILYVPKGSKVTWKSPDRAKLFYATFPANWPDLMPQQ